MKRSNLEPFYLILSLILLGFSGFVYLTYGRQTTSPSAITTNLTSQTASSKQTETAEEKVDYSQIETKLNDLTQNPTADGINSLKAEVEALADSPEKTQFLDNLTTLELDLSIIASIQENLALAETTAIADYFSAAQTGIDSLTSETKKTELQSQLNTLYTNQTGLEWSR